MVEKKIRVVVADDSALMRKRITEILNSDSNIEVIAAVRNGKEALDSVYSLKPDVVTLDVEMPVLDGLNALGYIMSECPTPVVMISAFTKEGADESIKALEYGAVDFVAKPGGVISPNIKDVGQEIIKKVKMASKVSVSRLKMIWAEKPSDAKVVSRKPSDIKRVFAIASSTGGTQALSTIIPKLSADLAASVLVVQHMPAGFTKSLAERLNWQSKIAVAEAEEGMLIKPAQVIIAKGGCHMEVSGSADKAKIAFSDGPSLHGLKPCADIMMKSVAKIFGSRVVGIVLTGMGTDGTLGSEAIKSNGGLVFAQDEKSCVVYGMPKSVADNRLVDKVYSLHDIPEKMERLLKKG